MAMNNSLAEVHPELVSEWSEKNLTLTPDDITFGSNKKVWWRGACGHEWQASVKARSNGEKCPICSGARVIAGINDLATLEPLLAKQWSKKNKIKPTEVSIGSHKKVIWRCEKGHEWEAAVKSRTKQIGNSVSNVGRLLAGKGTKEASDEKSGVALTRAVNKPVKKAIARLEENLDSIDRMSEKLDKIYSRLEPQKAAEKGTRTSLKEKLAQMQEKAGTQNRQPDMEKKKEKGKEAVI